MQKGASKKRSRSVEPEYIQYVKGELPTYTTNSDGKVIYGESRYYFKRSPESWKLVQVFKKPGKTFHNVVMVLKDKKKNDMAFHRKLKNSGIGEI